MKARSRIVKLRLVPAKRARWVRAAQARRVTLSKLVRQAVDELLSQDVPAPKCGHTGEH